MFFFCYFLQCDHTNTAVSDLCDLSSGDLNPSIWAQAARSEFENQTGSVPDFLQKGPDNATTRMTNRRFYVPDPDKRKALAFQVPYSSTIFHILLGFLQSLESKLYKTAQT